MVAQQKKDDQPAASDSDRVDAAISLADSNSQPADDKTISWTASEFIAHQKSVGWYVILAAVTIVIAGLIYFLTKDLISTIVVVVGALTFGIYAARQPRQLDYHLDNQGVTIGSKYHAYDEFRSFAIVPEGAFSSIIFMPLKRFGQLTTIYLAPADEDKIVQLLSNILPVEEHRHDAIDQLMRRIRF
jgi:hypothetical protein